MSTRGDPNGAFEIIVKMLVPYLGRNMARAALEVNRDKLGLHGPELAPNDIDRLLELLGSGLRVFLGQDGTARILGEIRAALAKGGGQ